jgi:hypothetical protein
MEKKRVRADGTCTCCLGHKPKLQAALHGIRHNLGREAVRLEILLQPFAYSFCMIVRSAVLTAVFRGIPLPFLFSFHMVAEHDCRQGLRHEAVDEFCLTPIEVRNRDGPHITAGEWLYNGLHDIFAIGRHRLP